MSGTEAEDTVNTTPIDTKKTADKKKNGKMKPIFAVPKVTTGAVNKSLSMNEKTSQKKVTKTQRETSGDNCKKLTENISHSKVADTPAIKKPRKSNTEARSLTQEEYDDIFINVLLPVSLDDSDRVPTKKVHQSSAKSMRHEDNFGETNSTEWNSGHEDEEIDDWNEDHPEIVEIPPPKESKDSGNHFKKQTADAKKLYELKQVKLSFPSDVKMSNNAGDNGKPKKTVKKAHSMTDSLKSSNDEEKENSQSTRSLNPPKDCHVSKYENDGGKSKKKAWKTSGMMESRENSLNKGKANKQYQGPKSFQKDFQAKNKVAKRSGQKELLKEQQRKRFSQGKNKKKMTREETSDDSSSSDEEIGTWVQCCNLWCKKWRYLPDVDDPARIPDKWVCSMNTDKKHNSCESAEVKYDESEHIFTKFTPGSVVWAKMDGYPWWPAMIESDCDYDTYFELLSEDSMHPTQYHVSFFDDCVSRAWIKAAWISPYQGQQPRNSALSKRSQSHKKEIEIAKRNADYALKLSLKERLETYGFATRYSRHKRQHKQYSGNGRDGSVGSSRRKVKKLKTQGKKDSQQVVVPLSRGSCEQNSKKDSCIADDGNSTEENESTDNRNCSSKGVTSVHQRKERFDKEIFTMEASTAQSQEAELPSSSAGQVSQDTEEVSESSSESLPGSEGGDADNVLAHGEMEKEVGEPVDGQDVVKGGMETLKNGVCEKPDEELGARDNASDSEVHSDLENTDTATSSKEIEQSEIVEHDRIASDVVERNFDNETVCEGKKADVVTCEEKQEEESSVGTKSKTSGKSSGHTRGSNKSTRGSEEVVGGGEDLENKKKRKLASVKSNNKPVNEENKEDVSNSLCDDTLSTKKSLKDKIPSKSKKLKFDSEKSVASDSDDETNVTEENSMGIAENGSQNKKIFSKSRSKDSNKKSKNSAMSKKDSEVQVDGSEKGKENTEKVSKIQRDQEKSFHKVRKHNNFSAPQISKSSSHSDGVVPSQPLKENGTNKPKKSSYARAVRPAVTDQNVPDLEADVTSIIESEGTLTLKTDSSSVKKQEKILRDSIDKLESGDEEESFDLGDVYKKSVQSPRSKVPQDSDCESLDLEVDAVSPKVIAENVQGIQGDIHGRFAGTCFDQGSDSDPFDAIEQ
ncbi:hepatoma-derived growth factor-related protein 2 isoform X2 [Aplysia californica]|nr:hepatoma-derived growth factor-related protein 2 isoform X2 [Aplysia californica]